MSSNPNRTTHFKGRFSDGKSAKAHTVDGSFTLTGLEFRVDAGASDVPAVPFVWPYDSLKTATPLSPHAPDVSITCIHAEDATLFVSSQGFCAELSQRAPHLKTGAQLWQQLKPIFLTTGAIASIVGVIYALGLSIAGGIASALPNDVRQTMGRGIIDTMTNEHKLCTTPEGTAALNRLKEKLRRSSGTPNDFNVYVLNWNIENAFAAPGENIVIARGILDNAKSADELAGVLAHEMGHGILRHPETGIVRQLGISTGVQLLFGGSYSTLATAGAVIAQLSYTREAEREADDHALRILETANISRKGLADFFRRMQAASPFAEIGQSKDGNNSTDRSNSESKSRAKQKAKSPPRYSEENFEFFQTHPATSARIKKIEGMLDDKDNNAEPAMSDADWKEVRAICSNLPKPVKKKRTKKNDI